MANLRDGLGFEEVNQSGLSTPLIQSVSGLHTRVVGTNVIGTTDVSGLNVFAQASGTFGRITNANGALLPISEGSPSTYGLSMQVGTSTTNAAGVGSIIFGRAFANTTYRISLTPGSTSAIEGVQGVIGSMQPVISGLKITSGLDYFGGITQPYDFIAVGLI